MSFAVAAMALTACQKEIEQPNDLEQVKVSSHVSFYAEAGDPATRATLTTTDEKSFKAAWEETDQVSLYAYDGDTFDETQPATWDPEKGCFDAEFETTVPTEPGAWMYEATYPYTTDGNIPFGTARVQNGNAYNSAYDVMYGTVDYDNALLGKDNNGNVFVIPMSRLTGIAYFHITGGPDEEDVVSATLEATGIAAESVTIASDGSSVTPSTTLNSITITFAEGTAPKASDLKLWFNVLPGSYSGLKLTINTATKTAVLNSNKQLTYTAGKLNKAVLSNLTWITPTAGDPYTWNLASGDLGTTGSPLASVSKGTPALTWSADYTWGDSGANKYFGWDGNKGVQIGSGSATNKCSSVVLSTSGYTDYIQNIQINFAHASSGGASVEVSVGGTSLTYESNTSASATTSSADYLFTSTSLLKGDVEITFSNSAAKAFYIKSISINPDTRQVQTLSFPESAYSVELTEGTFAAPTLSGANTTVTYDSSDKTVATVADDGTVTLLTTGSTTITATAAADDTYQEGSASYTLTVNPGPSSIADVLAASLDASVYTTGIVAQVNLKGFIITDGTNNILVYENAAPTVVEGQSVKVSGTRDAYNNIPQISSPVITKGATGQSFDRGTPTVITSTNATGHTRSVYVSLTGTLTISGNYTNIAIEGSTTQGSLYQLDKTIDFTGGKVTKMDGKEVTVLGYVAGSTAGYLNIAVVDVILLPYIDYTAPENAGFADNSTTTIAVDANVTWTAAKGTDNDNIIKNVTYNATSITVTFNANTDDAEKTATIVITPETSSGLSTVEVTVKQNPQGGKTNQVLFHETFGDNSSSARVWNDSYSVKSGVEAVYSNISSYTITNAKQSKNTMGSTDSGLTQTTQGTDAVLIIGPLDVESAENMVLTYQWKAASIKGTYSTHLYYATSATGTYTEVTGTGSGATSFVERSYTLPSAAEVSTLFLKIVWNTSNAAAIIDEVNLQGDY